ncbi:MAG: TetR/AcrR family transcriptional regulator [Castellaniella sp.]|uniref:TetR/AcrR family transcriptional regulator n=1 Tax=Castellaniella sp. TaxID=1955812 RepID=UPI003C782A0F
MPTDSPVKRRRRDAVLEQAILGQAWAELLDHGYAGLTLARVAERSGTSRTVLARRWSGKADLAVAAVRHELDQRPFDAPDLGGVRVELLDYLQRISELADVIGLIFSMLLDASFRETYASPQDLRDALMRGRQDAFAIIVERAIRRGELEQARLTQAVMALLNDLLGNYVLLHRAAPPQGLCIAWVDEVFLPLVRKSE